VSAVAGRRTLLVECDFRRSVLASRFGVDPAPGLSDYVAGGLKPDEVLRTVEVEGREAVDVLPLIPAGEDVFQPTELIASQRFKQFVQKVTRAYDLVVFDSAPLLPVGDTLELLPQMDAVLLCVRLEQTTRDQTRAAKQALDHLGDKPTGLVITGLHRGGPDDYYGYYSSYREVRATARAD
jgi:Mrp family chromosome partitioning ATPase